MGGMAQRKIAVAAGAAAFHEARELLTQDKTVPRATLATAVRFALEELEHRYPGNTVEVRVPPFGAVQCIEGPRHTRGTPPNVIECDAETWLSLADGSLSWVAAREQYLVSASGTRADLAAELPIFSGGS